MNDLFDMLIGGKFPRERLLATLGKVYGIPLSDINVQFADQFDMSCQVRRLFCYVVESDNDPFPVLLTLSYSDIESDYNSTAIACKLSHALGCSGLISGDRPDDNTFFLINGLEPPKLVIVYEEFNEVLQRTDYILQNYD